MPGLGDEYAWYCPTVDDSADDLSGNGYHCTYENGMGTVADTESGGLRAYSCNGVDQRAANYTSPAGSTYDNWCVAAWLKPNDLATLYRVGFIAGSNVAGNGVACPTTSERPGGLLGQVGWLHADSAAVVNQWIHVLLQRDTVNTRLWINGVEQTAQNSSNPRLRPIGMMIGHNASNSYFSGLIDDCRFFERTLTQEEITHLASARGVQGPPGAGEDFLADGVVGLNHIVGQIGVADIDGNFSGTGIAGVNHVVGQIGSLTLGDSFVGMGMVGINHVVGQVGSLQLGGGFNGQGIAGVNHVVGQIGSVAIGGSFNAQGVAGTNHVVGQVGSIAIGGSVNLQGMVGYVHNVGMTGTLDTESGVMPAALCDSTKIVQAVY